MGAEIYEEIKNFKEWYSIPVNEVLSKLHVHREGLGFKEAEQRLSFFGKNKLAEAKKRGILSIIWEQINNWLIWVLLIATALSFLLGEVIDSIAILAIVILIVILGTFQDYKAQKTIEALKKLSKPKTKVIRQGQIIEIDSEEVVPGDVLVLEEGTKISADARVIEAHSLYVDESILTGESVAVEKTINALKKAEKPQDMKNIVFSGTSVTRGRGLAVVIATGMATKLGEISKFVSEEEDTKTLLERKLDQLGKQIGYVLLFLIFSIFILDLLRSSRGFVDTLLTAVSLAVAAIPEGLPAVVTISLAIGVRKLAKKKTLVRKLKSVETLGSVTVICTDKTGTLTKNEMTVRKFYCYDNVGAIGGAGYDIEGKVTGKYFPELFICGALCNNATLKLKGSKANTFFGDPTEIALLVSAYKVGLDVEKLKAELPRVEEVPFSSERKMMSTIHKTKKGYVVFSKGAVEVILEKCDRIKTSRGVRKLTKKDKEKILKQANSFASQALRVLAFAYRDINKVPKKLEDVERNLVFVGLQAMIDPPRPEAIEAIKKCREAGIRVVMITGDNIETAKAIAKEIGIEGKAIEGKDLKNIDLEKEIYNIGVYARVDPIDKLKIVEAFRAKGEIVAMTGDGVNDAPALKKADIGVAVGSGTDVAKEASDIIITDDNFATLANAVEEGRNIYLNIKKFVNYLLSANFGEVGLFILASLFLVREVSSGNVMLPLAAIQLLWLNLVTDSLPAIALAFDPPPKNLMKIPPRDPKEPILSKALFAQILIIGSLVAISSYLIFRFHNNDAFVASSLTLNFLVFLELVRVQMIREVYGQNLTSNKVLLWSLAGLIALQFLVAYSPLAPILKLLPLSLEEFLQMLLFIFITYFVGRLFLKLEILLLKKMD